MVGGIRRIGGLAGHYCAGNRRPAPSLPGGRVVVVSGDSSTDDRSGGATAPGGTRRSLCLYILSRFVCHGLLGRGGLGEISPSSPIGIAGNVSCGISRLLGDNSPSGWILEGQRYAMETYHRAHFSQLVGRVEHWHLLPAAGTTGRGFDTFVSCSARQAHGSRCQPGHSHRRASARKSQAEHSVLSEGIGAFGGSSGH